MTETSIELQKAALPRWLGAVAAEIAAQKARLFLWAPVALACGVGGYFALRFEPTPLVTFGAALTVLAVWLLALPFRQYGDWRYPAWVGLTALLLAALGFAGAQARSLSLNTVMLEKPVGPVTVEGRISNIDILEEGQGIRLILRDPVIERVTPDKTPQAVRIKVRTAEGLLTGDRISVLARLNTPSAPVAPRAFDFQRYAYFSGIGAFGFAFDKPVVLAHERQSSFGELMESLRHKINARITSNMSFPEAGTAQALVTGERTSIKAEDWDAMRSSGLAHMISISGMHVGMVAGLIFFATRFLMALFPPLALRYPIKKYAAVLAFAAAAAYTLLATFSVPTIRALIMTGIVLLAVILDRVAISPRVVAIAALFVLLAWPESLWGASFQMSFAAVAALVVFYDWLRPYWSDWYRGAGRVRRLALYFLGISLTTVIATIATAPFSLYHFQQLALYSLPANFFAVPLLAFIVMPAAVLACLLMPLHLEGPALWVMQKGVAGILFIAHTFAEQPGSVWHMAAWPLAGLLLTVVAALIFMLWRGWGRMLAIVPLLAAVIVIGTQRQPDIYVSSSAKLMALRDDRGDLHVSSRVRDRFSAEEWMRLNGQDPEEKPEKWPEEGAGPIAGFVCGEEGCRLERAGRRVAFSFSQESQAEDCGWAEIIISDDPLEIRSCKSALAIDRFDLWRNGAYAVWLDGRYETVQSVRGSRPWTISPRR